MITPISFEITQEDYYRALRLHGALSTFLITMILVTSFCVMILILLLMLEGAVSSRIVFLIGCLLFGGMGGAYLGQLIYAKWQSACSYRKNVALHGALVMSWTEDNLVLQHGEQQSSIAWFSLCKWKENENLFLLYTSNRAYLIFPKHCFPDACLVSEFRDRLIKSKQTINSPQIDLSGATIIRLKIANISGVPVYVDWTVLLVGIWASIISGSKFPSFIYITILCACIILLHELGHFAAARFFKLNVSSIVFSGIGGNCLIQTPRGVWDTFFVMSAGILAQIILLLGTILYLHLVGEPTTALGRSVASTFVLYNFIIIIFNLVPRKTLNGTSDGMILWQLLKHVIWKTDHPFPDPSTQTHIFPPEARLLTVPSFAQQNFTTGIEFLNDDTTPMEFVVAALVTHLKIEKNEAFRIMLAIHKSGGYLMPISDIGKAELIVAAMMADAQSQGHKFICRAVDKSRPIDLVQQE